MRICLRRCLFLCYQLCAETFEPICMKFSVKVGNGPVNKMIKFRLATVTVFRIDHYWEIGKVVNGHKSGAHTDSPDGGTGKTCFGGGMHCPSASSFECNQCQQVYNSRRDTTNNS